MDAGAGQLAIACERFGEGFFGQPANAVTSLAFVIAGLAILAGRGVLAERGGRHWVYAGLVAAVGVGSLVQHGPHPSWQAYAHDLPLASLLGFVAADAAADLTGRRGVRHWWLAVPLLSVPVVAAGPLAATVAQGLLAAVAIGLNLARARHRPWLRRTLLPALAILAAGALAGSLTDRTGLCQPESLLQGHAAWHLLAAGALWWLAPAIGSASRAGPAGGGLAAGGGGRAGTAVRRVPTEPEPS